MGGLSGIVHFDRSPLDREVLVRMTDAAAHRGPQGVAYLLGSSCGFASLNLSPDHGLGEPPPQIEPGAAAGVHIVADARLDQRGELRKQLAHAGRRVGPGASDTALLLAAYGVWGVDCVQRLEGDFAFVVWDYHRRRVFCARDRFGVKPLHYRFEDQRFYAASEAQQLVRGLRFEAKLDEVALADYLTDQSWDEGRSFFSGVHRLPPASTLVIESGEQHLRRYWDPAEGERGPSEDAAEELSTRLQQAVEERLSRAGETVGIAMSGGLDSCSVAAVAHEALRQREDSAALVAFTFAFDTLTECDEGAYTAAMSSELGLEVEPVDAESRWLLSEPRTLESSLDNPFQGWQEVDRRLFERLRERGGRVLLTGLGGDNLFGGSYRVFLSRLRRGQWAALADLRRLAQRRGLSFPRAVYGFLLAPLAPSGDRLLRRALGRPTGTEVPPWIASRFAQRTNLAARLRGGGEAGTSRDPALRAHWRSLHRLESVGRAVYWLDRAAGEHGIEVRHPLLDRRLAELVLAVPPEEHFGAAGGKELLRRSMRGRLPETVRTRRQKTRFGAFIDWSLCNQERSTVESLLREPMLADLGIIDLPVLHEHWRAYAEEGHLTLRGHIWYILTLELWLRRLRKEEWIARRASPDVRSSIPESQ